MKKPLKCNTLLQITILVGIWPPKHLTHLTQFVCNYLTMELSVGHFLDQIQSKSKDNHNTSVLTLTSFTTLAPLVTD